MLKSINRINIVQERFVTGGWLKVCLNINNMHCGRSIQGPIGLFDLFSIYETSYGHCLLHEK
jgi:hypothetical protein